MKNTDCLRLEWLMLNAEEFMEDECGGGCCMSMGPINRRLIDAAMRRERLASKPKKARGGNI